ncbi:MAG: Ig-like domain-containing protein, partial [Acidobacteriaceae bacterium]
MPPGFPRLKLIRLVLTLCATLAVIGLAARANAQCTGSNPYTCTVTQSVSIPAGPNGTGFGTWVPASVYPSELTVSGLTGTISNISVQLHGLTSDGQGSGLGTNDLGVLLESPNGTYLELMGQAGNGNNGELWTGSGVLLNIQDGGTQMPIAACPGGSQTATWPNLVVSNGSSEGGPFKPTSCPFGETYDTYPSPGPGTLTSGEVAEPTGMATLNGLFDGLGGSSLNGTWKLYLVNDEGESSIDDDQSISGWSLVFTLNQTQSGTTTTMSSSTNPSFTSGTGNSTTLTATVTGTPSPSGGTVAFKDGGNTISCTGGNQTLSGGEATCIVTFTTQGSHALSAVYSGSGTFAGSTGSLNQFVETPTTGSFCNAGTITMPGQDDTSPYPSVINVTGITNAVATVSLTLSDFSWSAAANGVHLLLVAPSNQAFEFFAATTNATGGGAYTFTDSGSQITEADEETTLSPGTWQPAVYTVAPPSEDVFTPEPPAPAPQVPGSFTVAAPRGNPSAGTFENTFNGATANGAWALFAYDDDGTTASGSITGGWCLDITQASGAATTTTVTTAPNPSLTGVGVTVTATVKSGGNPVNSEGTVTFTENGQNVAGGPTSPVSVNSGGQASFSTTALPEGDHNILATYNGVAGTYALSFGSKIQRVDNTTTASISAGVISYCNPGKITIPSLSNSTDEGQASPNPSNIFVTNAPGTINHATVTLNGVELSTPYYLTSLLVGPLNTTANSLDFFSDVGGSTPMSAPVNLTLDDNASSSLGTGSGGAALEAGSFKPTSGKGNDTFFASTDGFYTPPSSPYLYAEPFGSSTLGEVFDSQNPNGTWSLYLNQDNQSANSSMSSWCVNITENPPAIAVTLPGTGTFAQGQQNASFT